VAWLIVLSDARAASWVIENETMAFRASARAGRTMPGDHFAIYVSRSAHGNPTRDEAQIVAVGTVASKVRAERVDVAGRVFDSTCSLSIEASLPLRSGVPFRPLVERLTFIRLKDKWPAYVRRTIVEIPELDFSRIASAVAGEAARQRKSHAL
jgi:hypothetical protein